MADISKINGVEIGDISKVDNVGKDDIDKLLSGEVPASQANPALTSLTNDIYNAHRGTGVAVAYDTDNSVMAFGYGDAGNSYYPTIHCASASGTTLTFGDEVVLASVGNTNHFGLVYNNDASRFMFAYPAYDGDNNIYNNVDAGAATVTASGSGSPKISSVGALSNVYDPYEDDSNGEANVFTPVGNFAIYDHSDGASAGRMIICFKKGGPGSGSSVAGANGDIVASAISMTDVSSNNNVTVGALAVVAAAAGVNSDVMLSWNEQRNKVVVVTQDTSGTYQIQAATITGSGATITVGTQSLLDTGSGNIFNHNEAHGGSSESRNTVDNSHRLVYDGTSNCHHILAWDDSFDDFHLFNFTVAADNSITWTASNGAPLRSNGIIAQFGNVLTRGQATGWDTSTSNTLGLAFSSGRGRGAILGHDGTSHSTADTQVVTWGYTAGEGYSFKGVALEMFTNAPKKDVTSSSGTHHISDDGFVGKNLFFVGYNADTDANMSEIGAIDTGVGLVTAANGVFSLGNATLPANRSRLAGFGQSRIASMTAGGNNNSGTPQLDTDEYNGSVLSAGGNMAIARHSAGGCGTLGAGFVFSGTGTGGHAADSSPLTVTTGEEYDGSSFSTSGASSSMGGDGVSMAGVQTDALGCGGYITGYRKDCESYNGSSWSSEADGPVNFNYARMAGRGQGDALHFQGSAGSGKITGTYQYNGTAWSTLNSTSNGNNVMQAAGISTDAVSTGGGRVANNDSEIWDGTSWATGPTNANSRYSPSDAVDCNGTFASVFFAGGTGSGNSTGTSVVVHLDR